MTKHICVYVAGPISAGNVIDFLTNIRRGLRLTREVILAGFSAFPTFADFMISLQGRVPLEAYYRSSMGWLERADAVVVQIQGCESSKGTQAELARARELNIPISRTVKEMVEHYGKTQDVAEGD